MAGGRALSTRCLQGLGQGGSWLSRTPSGPSLDAFLLVFDGHPEALFQQGELADEVRDGVGEGLLWAVVRRGLHADDDLVLQGVRDFVASEEHLGILQQLRFNDISQRVVFLVDGEQTGIGHLGVLVDGDLLLALEE